MILGASELILLNDDPIENAKKLSSIVPEVEMMLDGNGWDDQVKCWSDIAHELADLKINYTIHPPAWDHNVAAGLGTLRSAAQQLNKNALEVALITGTKQMVFHTGYCDRNSRFDRKTAQKYSMEFLEELIDLAKPKGITIAVENVSSLQNALYSQEEFIHILDGVDSTAQYLIDIGHANCNGWNIPWILDKISSRLCGLHIHDNNGKSDQHLPIFCGTVPWNDVFEVMKTLRNDCHFILEYFPGTDLEELRTSAQILKDKFA